MKGVCVCVCARLCTHVPELMALGAHTADAPCMCSRTNLVAES